MKVLFSFVGPTDLKAAGLRAPDKGEETVALGLGPLGEAVLEHKPDEVRLILPCGKEKDKEARAPYETWLRRHTPCKNVKGISHLFPDPTDHGLIYRVARLEVQKRLDAGRARQEDIQLYFCLSPGTPTMHAVWMLLGKAVFNARLLKSVYGDDGRKWKVIEAKVPFDIRAELTGHEVPGTRQDFAEELLGMLPEGDGSFAEIPARSARMKVCVAQARIAAAWDRVPVLLLGEIGSGMTTLAQAILAESPRAHRPFRIFNCGALPGEEIEAKLFNALAAVKGGTLFIDEIEKLPMRGQVRLAELLSSQHLHRKAARHPPDARVIAAAARDLPDRVAHDRFRQDLFYYLSLAAIDVPALREREGDLIPLVKLILARIHENFLKPQGRGPVALSTRAETRLVAYSWPGNIRQLTSVLSRAVLWTRRDKLDEADIERAIIEPVADRDGILNRPVGRGSCVDIEELLSQVKRHYLARALREARTKTEAAELVKLPSPQTFRNWCKDVGVEID